MNIRLLTYALLALLLTSCHTPVEPQTVAGYIVGTPSAEQITIAGDTIGVRRFNISDETIIEGGTLVEGNIAEIIFTPTDDEGTLPDATLITTDKTYSQALGRWATSDKAQLKIDIELLPHGRIEQSAPDQVLSFERWQITGCEDEIMLYGTLSLPPDWSQYTKAQMKEKDFVPPTRREQHFSVKARLDKESDSNTEIRRVIVVSAAGRESKLYLQQ